MISLHQLRRIRIFMSSLVWLRPSEPRNFPVGMLGSAVGDSAGWTKAETDKQERGLRIHLFGPLILLLISEKVFKITLNTGSFLGFRGVCWESGYVLWLRLNEWLRFLFFAVSPGSIATLKKKKKNSWKTDQWVFFTTPLFLLWEDEEADTNGACHNGGLFVYFLI